MAREMARKFRGWKKLERESHRWFDKDEDACNDNAAVEVVYNAKKDKVSFYVHVNRNSHVELDDDEIQLGYVQCYLSSSAGYGGYEWCEEMYKYYVENGYM